MQRLICILVFLVLVPEFDDFAEGAWHTPISSVANLIYLPVPGPHFPLFFLFFGLILLIAGGSSGAQWNRRVLPVDRGIRLALLTCVGMYAWGIARGGNFKIAMFQTQYFVMMYVMALAIAGTFRTAAQFTLLGKTILLAAVYRAVVAVIVYFRFVRTGAHALSYVTTHGDTVLFVVAAVMVMSYALELKTKRAIAFCAALATLFLMAINYNNRRLAWVSLLGALAIVFIFLPSRKVRRAVISVMLALTPVLIMYVVVGWGRTESIFRPVQSLSSMFGSTENVSSEMRNIENYNLIVTFNTYPILGTGWGHGYIEVSRAISITSFFLWYREVPHNTLLGVLAFTGVVGFAGIWLTFPIVVHACIRLYRAAQSPIARVIAATAISTVAIYGNQVYGDMGLLSPTGSMIMAIAIAAAYRVPVAEGGWPDPTENKHV